MGIFFGIWLPMLPLALGIFMVLKTRKPAWKIIGWVLVAISGLLLVLSTWTDLKGNSLPIFLLTRGLSNYRFSLLILGVYCPSGQYRGDGKSGHRPDQRRPF
jgi:hypothetical protein